MSCLVFKIWCIFSDFGNENFKNFPYPLDFARSAKLGPPKNFCPATALYFTTTVLMINVSLVKITYSVTADFMIITSVDNISFTCNNKYFDIFVDHHTSLSDKNRKTESNSFPSILKVGWIGHPCLNSCSMFSLFTHEQHIWLENIDG